VEKKFTEAKIIRGFEVDIVKQAIGELFEN